MTKPDTTQQTPPYVVVIPSRYDSTRLPGKALANIGGRPLIEWVWRCAELSGAQRVIVATDDDRIATACSGFGASVCMTRRDHHSGTDRLAEVAQHEAWADQTVVVNLQGDEPDTAPENLDAVAQCLVDHPDAAMATLSVPLTDEREFQDPNCVKVVTDKNGYALYFSRAAIPSSREPMLPNPPAIASRHIGLYAYRAGFLARYAQLSAAPLESIESLEQLRVLWHGERIAVATAPQRPGPGVDTPDDLERVRRDFAERSHDN